MKRHLFPLLLCICASSVVAAESDTQVYEGSWRTTNRKLDGTMTCAVTELGSEKWRGRFYGVWQGVAFDYTVEFVGRPSDLTGTAKIDGADYTWKGKLSLDSFNGRFGGNRYAGCFDLGKSRTPTWLSGNGYVY